MTTSRLVKDILLDMNRTITELRGKELLRDEKGITQIPNKGNTLEISYQGKNDASSIVYDKHITSGDLIDTLLTDQQYTILLYDKSLIQAEFIVKGKDIIKERLVFMKKHNKIWEADEIKEYENNDEDWFAEDFGVPIMFRIDYAPEDHIECDHAATHLTISNHESCRIPMKGIVTFSEFVRFILLHVYGIRLDLKACRSRAEDTITELEKQMIHMDWN